MPCDKYCFLRAVEDCPCSRQVRGVLEARAVGESREHEGCVSYEIPTVSVTSRCKNKHPARGSDAERRADRAVGHSTWGLSGAERGWRDLLQWS